MHIFLNFIVFWWVFTCSNRIWVLQYPVRNDQSRKHREAKHEDVAGWIHICILKMERIVRYLLFTVNYKAKRTIFWSRYLQIGHSSCCNDTKHHYEHPTHDGRWNGGEYSTHFAEDTHDNHHDPTDDNHHTTANLHGNQDQPINPKEDLSKNEEVLTKHSLIRYLSNA